MNTTLHKPPNWKCTVAIALFITASQQSHAIAVSVDGVNKESVDLLIGHFGRLVTAFEKFAIAENSILEQRIDQAFARFDEAIACNISVGVERGGNRLESILPDWSVFRSAESNACQAAVLSGRGTGGLLDRVTFERCVIMERISKGAPIEAIGSGYSGVKEKANAAYCQFKGKPESEEFALAKLQYSELSILVAAYAELPKTPGCTSGEIDKLTSCIKTYNFSQRERLNKFNAIDTARINIPALEAADRQLPSPTSYKNWMFQTLTSLPRGNLSIYETTLSNHRRAIEVASASLVTRKQALAKVMAQANGVLISTEDILKKDLPGLERDYLGCGAESKGYCTQLKWPNFDVVVSEYNAAKNQCAMAIKQPNFVDQITAENRKDCLDRTARLDQRIEAVLTHFKNRSRQQSDGARPQGMIDRGKR